MHKLMELGVTMDTGLLVLSDGHYAGPSSSCTWSAQCQPATRGRTGPILLKNSTQNAYYYDVSSIWNGCSAPVRLEQSYRNAALHNSPPLGSLIFGQNLGEILSANMTSAPVRGQTGHVKLPSHDSHPLSERTSMRDQSVHTLFIADRNDLGTLLPVRRDHCQHKVTTFVLEIGQFQVHIDQRDQQKSLSDRQSRGHGEAPK